MLARKTFSWLGGTLVAVSVLGLAAAQDAVPPPRPPAPAHAPPAAPARNPVKFDDFVDSALRQERRLIELMRYYKPVVETYIQEEKPDRVLGTVPRNDDYFIGRLDLTGKAPANLPFEQQESFKQRLEKGFAPGTQPFAAVGFAQAVFPDLNHFDRQNYTFEFVRWETLGEVRCAVINVKPRENSHNRGFVGRIWVEDKDFSIVRFTGTYTAKALSRRAFHFDSWRVNTLSIMWMPAYVYTEETDPHDPSSHGLWFKAQTRIWGYDLEHAGDHREFAKPLTDTPAWVDPKRHEASQDLSPAYTLGKTAYMPEDDVVERLQVAGLMAPHGDVDEILHTVTNNLLVTNDLDIAAVRCRVLLTTPLESFVVGRTIVLSRGLIDVLPDEPTLAAVLAHELAHIVLGHSLADAYLSTFSLPFSDLETFTHFNFRFSPAEEAAADKKALELFAKSPYKDQLANAALFLEALEARSPQLPNLLHGRFSNDFESSHLVGLQTLVKSPRPHLRMDRLDQIPALPLGSRIKLDPWSDRIEMMKTKPVTLLSPSEKMPFEVSPFFPYLKRLEEPGKAKTGAQVQQSVEPPRQ